MGLCPRGGRGAGCGALRSRRWRPSPGSRTARPPGSTAGSVSRRVATRGPRLFPLCRGPGGARGCHLPPEAQCGVRSACGPAPGAQCRAPPPTLESFLAPRGRPERELETDFAGAGFGAGWRWCESETSRARSRCVRRGQAKATPTRNLESGRVSADFRSGFLGLRVWLCSYWWFG